MANSVHPDAESTEEPTTTNPMLNTDVDIEMNETATASTPALPPSLGAVLFSEFYLDAAAVLIQAMFRGRQARQVYETSAAGNVVTDPAAESTALELDDSTSGHGLSLKEAHDTDEDSSMMSSVDDKNRLVGTEQPSTEQPVSALSVRRMLREITLDNETRGVLEAEIVDDMVRLRSAAVDCAACRQKPLPASARVYRPRCSECLSCAAGHRER